MVKEKARKEILVYADWQGIQQPAFMGKLFADVIRGKEIFSFEYSEEWLQSEFAQVIDPDLQLFKGPQYLNSEKSNFGIFLDSSPDRWGRMLMKRREAILAREKKRPEKKLLESDFLLGVYDEHRPGGLRFKLEEDGPFLNHDRRLAAPPWASLRELEEASLKIEKEKNIDDPDYFKWLKMLIAPGSSLGGARPKASVIDKNGNLWIAKFPGSNDNKNVEGWEMVVNNLAKACGINVPQAKLDKFSNDNNTFLIKRFDRNKKTRIHFASAMTMLGYKDGDDFHTGVSYLEIAEFLILNGANVNNDLEELWKRIVFNICVSNTDDHLRNHGFLLTKTGWILSPAFDMNPDEEGVGLSLNISETDNSLNLDLALDVSEHFRINRSKAKKISDNIRNKVGNWKKVADRFNISPTEKKFMKNAFRF